MSSQGDTPSEVTEIGIIGGTGPLGRGLAGRLAAAGCTVRLGSRDAARGRSVAAEVAADLDATGRPAGEVVGTDNLGAAEAPVVVVAVPFDGLDEALTPLRDRLGGRVVVSAVNPLAFDEQGPWSEPVAEGSAAAAVAARLPDARMTAAFHTLSGVRLRRLAEPMDDDVPVFGDDQDAVATVVALADRLEGCRGVAAGPLRLVRALEELTPVLVEVNRRNRSHVGIRFTRL